MLYRSVCALVCVCVSASWTFTLTIAASRDRTIPTLGLYEGDVCKSEKGVLWTCKKFLDCPKAINDYKETKKYPTTCSFQGSIDTFVVCCDPNVKAPPTGLKSKQMCNKYAEHVFITKTGGFLPGDVATEDTCAASEPLIAFGVDADPREFPHMALVGVGKKESIFWVCGGSLISERFVLSAAHCSPVPGRGPASWIRLGEYNVKSTQDNIEGQANPEDYRIIQTIKHPGWKPPSLYDDIVLFRLEREVTFNEFVRPACLQLQHNFPKEYAIATGWGKTENSDAGSDILMKVNLTLVGRTDCFKHYEVAMGGSQLKNGIRDETMLCAGDIETKKDACKGDSGGPLQLRLRDPYCMYSIIGVVSFGPTSCGRGYAPGVYTRVSNYVSWIERIVWP